MKITKIELQKNDNTRFNLYSDGEFIMSASSENLAPYGYVEFEISDAELKALKEKEAIELAYKKAVKYTSKAMKTSKEVKDYLYKLKLSEEQLEEIITRLEDLGLLNDEQYLEMYLNEKFNYTTDGAKKIKYKLYQKGFKDAEITPHLEKYKEQERENLKKAISQRMKTKKNEDKNKLTRYLLNKGFSFDMISEEIREYFDYEF